MAGGITVNPDGLRFAHNVEENLHKRTKDTKDSQIRDFITYNFDEISLCYEKIQESVNLVRSSERYAESNTVKLTAMTQEINESTSYFVIAHSAALLAKMVFKLKEYSHLDLPFKPTKNILDLDLKLNSCST